MFPDGELYDAPSQDELPDALSLDDLPAGVQQSTVYLGLPLMKEYGGNCGNGSEGAQAARYQQANRPTPGPVHRCRRGRAGLPAQGRAPA